MSTKVSRNWNARRVAYEVLRTVIEDEAYANLILPVYIRDAKLSRQEAAFATELTSQTLRMRGFYDRIIEIAAAREISAIEVPALNILRLGVHQLLAMRVPSHAAIFESVSLAKTLKLHRVAGFINAILRRIQKYTLDEWREKVRQSSKSETELEAQLASHPSWIIESFKASLRAENRSHEIAELLEADNRAPNVSLVFLADHHGFDTSSVTGISPIGAELKAGEAAETLATLEQGDLVRVQDQGSSLAALLLSRVKEPQPGESWLDLCAGPGGKSAVLASEAKKVNASLKANELQPHRAKLVEQALGEQAKNIEILNFDGRDPRAYGGLKHDRILIDAPCSGLGALRRRPESRWRKKESDILALNVLQSELLTEAQKHLTQDGVIAYVTCSPDLRETRQIIDKFLVDNPGFYEVDAKSAIQKIATKELDLGDSSLKSVQLWPHRHQSDAMFMSLLAKKAKA